MITTYILNFSVGVNAEIFCRFEMYKDHVFQGTFKVRITEPLGNYEIARFLNDRLEEPGRFVGRPITIFWTSMKTEYEKIEPVSESQDIAMQIGLQRVRGETDQQIIAAMIDPANPNFPTPFKL